MQVKETLDRRIILRRISKTFDSLGAPVDTETDLEIWASKGFRGGDGGNEYEEKGVVKQNYDIVFTIRYRNVDYNDKVVFQSKSYDIQRIEDAGGRNNYLRLFCNTDD